MKKKYLAKLLILFIVIFNISIGAMMDRLERVIYPNELDFKNVKLADALSIISKTSGITIVAESKVKDNMIDLYFVKGQNLKEILDAVMVANNLQAKEVNNIIILEQTLKSDEKTTGQIVGRVLSTDKLGITGAKIVLIKNNDVYKEVLSEAGGAYIFENINPGTYIIKGIANNYETNGDIVEIEQGKTLSINLYLNPVDSKENKGLIEVVEKSTSSENTKKLGIIKDKNGERFTEKITLKYAFADEVKQVITSMTDENSLEVISVKDQNLIILKGSTENIETAKNLIKELDKPIKQVRITAQILEITGTLTQELGIDWSYQDKDSVSSGITGQIAVATGNPIATFTSYLGNTDNVISSTINMLKQTDDASVNAVPSVVTLNGKTANLNVSAELKVGTTSSTDSDGNTTTEPLFKEAGTVLNVTPIIRDGDGEKDKITLEITSEVSSFLSSKSTNTLGDATEEDALGAAQKNKLTSIVTLEDGGVVFIGGLKKTTVNNSIYKVPVLGDMPIFGTFFKYESIIKNTRDLFIQIKAEIVNEDNKNNDIETKGFKTSTATLKQKIYK
ncbi:secretin N-terminal domain-containing protein [Hypnocyclicus thermotrophus]|nr:secretin N-terminal domain-containing protein [Hypnocyclicus thermotrophus]